MDLENPGKNPSDIDIKRGFGASEREAGDRAGSVFADSGEPLESCSSRWHLSFCSDSSTKSNELGASLITEAELGDQLGDVTGIGGCQGFRIRVIH